MATVSCQNRQRTFLHACAMRFSSTWMLVFAASYGAETSQANEPSVDVEVIQESFPVVDWGDWPEHAPELDSSDTMLERFRDREASGESEEGTGYGGSLYHLIDECARRLEIRSVSCGEEEYRLPFMESGDLPCGFQTRMTKGTVEDLASRFKFHFVGDSTIRRLAESFVSIVIGEGSHHHRYHEDRDLSRGSLQVMFHWAPYCLGREKHPSLSSPFEDVMSKLEKADEPDGGKRTVFITAFGVWEAENGSCDAAAMGDCTETMNFLVQETPHFGAGAKLGDGNDVPPPVVFLLQNNPFLPGSDKDAFLTELHQVQREAIENDETRSQAEVYLVHDRESLFDSMACYRIKEQIHFYEPVKLIEAKMMWDLIALLGDGGGN